MMLFCFWVALLGGSFKNLSTQLVCGGNPKKAWLDRGYGYNRDYAPTYIG
jgi:hypothetical protein